MQKSPGKKLVKSNKSKKNFSWNCIFGSFELFPSSKIDFWPFLKLQNFFPEIDLFEFTRFFFLPWTFFNFLAIYKRWCFQVRSQCSEAPWQGRTPKHNCQSDARWRKCIYFFESAVFAAMMWRIVSNILVFPLCLLMLALTNNL